MSLIKLSDWAQKCAEFGVRHVFMVTGGVQCISIIP
jgi:5,10-methylenetetrahydrofolate reductase